MTCVVYYSPKSILINITKHMVCYFGANILFFNIIAFYIWDKVVYFVHNSKRATLITIIHVSNPVAQLLVSLVVKYFIIHCRYPYLAICNCICLHVLCTKTKHFIYGKFFNHIGFRSCTILNIVPQCLQIPFHMIHLAGMYGPTNM